MLTATIARQLSAPRSLKKSKVTSSSVTIVWSAPKGKTKPKSYAIVRDGKQIATTKHRSYTDHTVKGGKTYRYSVRGIGPHRKRGKLAQPVKIKVPKAAVIPPPGPPTITPPIAPVVPGPGTTGVDRPMSAAMVERLYWRAGFGPLPAEKDKWAGKSVYELVDWMLETVPTLAPTSTLPLNIVGNAIDPVGDGPEDAVMEWLDTMQRADNPFPDRLTLFLHRHFAVSADIGIASEYMIEYRNRLRKYATFGSNPGASFRDLAVEMTTADNAMNVFLDIASNEQGAPNENYAREFMELFCLGIKGVDGMTNNYSQTDVQQLARAFTGWRVDANGDVYFQQDRFDPGTDKVLFGGAPFTTAVQGVDKVLAHPSHAQFLIRKLWTEFVGGPITQSTLDALVSTYTADNALKLKPLMRGILTDPQIFASIDEPNMIKQPTVYTVGCLRQMNAPMLGRYVTDLLDGMEQKPYHPPNVAGWEGGLSWLNSNTAQARFDLIVMLQYLKYIGYPGSTLPADIPGETAQQVFDRAYAASNNPWMSAGSRNVLLQWVNSAPATSVNERRQRFYNLQALMLGGPDGQVM